MSVFCTQQNLSRTAALLLGCLIACGLCGCWTIRETPRPESAANVLQNGVELRVQLAGFDALVTSYLPVYGYTTVSGWSDPWYGGRRRRWGGYYTSTVSTTDFIPQTAKTSAYLNRATDAFEKCGCILQTTNPQYRVEVRFEGPYGEDGDGWAKCGWMLCTIFTANFDAQNWAAKLKIHDVKTGKLVCERTFSQRYEAVVWGPIPIFSPGGSDRLSDVRMQDWCLTALTDRAVAEAMDYLNGLDGK